MGLAKDNSELNYSFCGTAEYLAPEMIEGISYIQKKRRGIMPQLISGLQDVLYMRCYLGIHHSKIKIKRNFM